MHKINCGNQNLTFFDLKVWVNWVNAKNRLHDAKIFVHDAKIKVHFAEDFVHSTDNHVHVCNQVQLNQIKPNI